MTRLLVDEKISPASEALLLDLGYDIIKTTNVSAITDSTSTHPDMQFVRISDKTALVEKTTLDYYKKILTDYTIIPVSGITSPYPCDCVLNITLLKDKCFLTEFQNKSIGCFLTDFTKIYVRQGYTKCNICVLSENSILTSDFGIIKSAQKFNLKAHYLAADEIVLEGYNNGFWGGCTGMIGKGRLFFNGNIENLQCYHVLLEILKEEKIEPIYSKDVRLTDIGSIINLD